MNREAQKAAVEMLMEEYLSKGETRDAEEAAGHAGRRLTEEEARQLFENAIIRNKPYQAIKAAGLISLSKAEKDRLLQVCLNTDFYPSALEVTGTKLSKQEFHRLVNRVIKNWDSQTFVIGLVRETGYALTNQEKEAFLDCMIEYQRGRGGYNEHLLREGLQFLGDWLSPEGAERLFTALEDYEFPNVALDSMIELAVLAKGKVNKRRILDWAPLVTSKLGLEALETAVQRATGDGLLLNDYRYLFNRAPKRDNHMSVEIACKHPEIIREEEFDELICSLLLDSVSCAISIIKAAALAGKLSLKVLKYLISQAQEPNHHVSSRIFVYSLALERGIDPKVPQSACLIFTSKAGFDP